VSRSANSAAAVSLDDRLIEPISNPIELVITGRWAHPQLVQAADLVTEMRKVKHYCRQGVMARTGIEK
jgi:cob(I)alamin adenosyltransferase